MRKGCTDGGGCRCADGGGCRIRAICQLSVLIFPIVRLRRGYSSLFSKRHSPAMSGGVAGRAGRHGRDRGQQARG